MKLYTEEQVNDAIGWYVKLKIKLKKDVTIQEAFSRLTPIELPSDDEVEKFINTLPYTKGLDDGQYNDGVINGAIIGIDWMRNKIQGGKNENPYN
jgi:hypothetical protein